MPETMSEFSIADQLTLHTIVQRGMATPRVPGVIAGVWAGSAGWTTAQGIADLRTAEPMMLDGHVRIASVSKTFVATVLLQLIAEGYSSQDIARRLTISAKTVDRHRANLMEKLDIHNIAGLVHFAIQNGLAGGGD